MLEQSPGTGPTPRTRADVCFDVRDTPNIHSSRGINRETGQGVILTFAETFLNVIISANRTLMLNYIRVSELLLDSLMCEGKQTSMKERER